MPDVQRALQSIIQALHTEGGEPATSLAARSEEHTSELQSH